jgi:UDP-N-acetylglucosamine--N-acetylmuramyl-(pentapeptide) pyrophosphoryl-undecaprenol N-acetylglucosamine transferase
MLWLGGEGGMEAALVSRAGIPLALIPAAGVHGVGLRALPGNLLRLARGLVRARRLIARFRPQAMLLTGGYVGVPAALAGWGVPKLVYVPDIEPGLALRLIARMAQIVAVTTEESRRHHARRKGLVVTGYPIRPELRPMEQARARRELGLDPAGRVLLVYGGSLGARSINEAVWSVLAELLDLAQIVHLTGDLDWPKVAGIRATLDARRAGRYHPYPYLHDEMARAMSSADLSISRAGASTLGELPLFGLPAVLVPYPHAWRYQKVNADYLVQRGAALMVDDARLAAELLPTVRALLTDPERLAAMSSAARRQAVPDAAARIAAEIERLAGGARD